MKDGGPAFPVPMEYFDDYPMHPATGMSLRQYYAGEAMKGLLSSAGNLEKILRAEKDKGEVKVVDSVSEFSRQQADSLIAELIKESEDDNDTPGPSAGAG